MDKEKKSTFNIVAKILICLLCVAIVVQICVMVYLQVEKQKLKEKNDDISQSQIYQNKNFEPDFKINLIK